MDPAPAGVPARIGRYEVLERIGRGGMAEVFLARAVGPGGIAKRLCIKRMLPDTTVTPRALERFTEEARTVLALQHANIVPVFDFGRDGQDLFLAMEWIDGCDLAALLAASRKLPPLVAAHVTAEVARALAYAHAPAAGRPGLLHSDVTPRNVLLSRQGEVRLTDFGIARALEGASARGGTPAYMAPEAARGEAADARADLYSLGLVFAEMLVGHRLRAGSDLEAARAAVEVPALAEVPAPIAEVARRLLAPAPRERFAAANEVVAALAAPLAAELIRGGEPPAQTLAALVARAAPAGVSRALESGPVTAAAPTVDLPAAPTTTERPRGRWLLLGLAIAAAVTGAIALTRSRPPAPPPLVALPAPPPPPLPAAPGPPPSAPPTRPRPAHLKITAPGSWVAVYLDGRKLGEGPGVFDIPPGRHELRVENAPRGFAHTETIEAAPGATLSFAFNTRR
jgi:tRNA A-37 threonylcarbamoyl transferase component Bud32